MKTRNTDDYFYLSLSVAPKVIKTRLVVIMLVRFSAHAATTGFATHWMITSCKKQATK